METVCHLTTVHKRYDTRIFIKECNAVATEFDVHLIVSDGLGNEEVGKVKIHDVGKPKRKAFRILLGGFKMLSIPFKIKARICHFHDPELMFVGFLLALFGKKVIYDVHEDFPVQVMAKGYLPLILRRILAGCYKMVEFVFVPFYSKVVTSTDYILNNYSTKLGKAVAVKNYPSLEDISAPKTSWQEKENAICYIGSLRKVRGILALVDSMQYCDHVTLYLAGSFDDKQLEEELKYSPGWSKVKYLGFLDRKGINALLEKSKIGMVTLLPLPNYLESLPVKMFEYMAAGIPVICSNFPFWKAIISEAGCGYSVDPTSSLAIGKMINKLITNEVLAQQLGEKGRAKVLDTYNWDIEGNKLVESYKEILGEK